jgi:hypothetical protein
MRNIHRALEFMRSAGGEHAEGYEKLAERVEQTNEEPWDLLPEVVRHRIEQWFHPETEERFLAYVPDRDYARTEDGVAGLVISSRRLVYHTAVRHREANVDEPLELAHGVSSRKNSVNITTPSWTLKRMTVDREGLARLRRNLTLGRFQAVWR